MANVIKVDFSLWTSSPRTLNGESNVTVTSEVLESPPGLMEALRETATKGVPTINPNDGSFNRLLVLIPGNFAPIHLYESFVRATIRRAAPGLAVLGLGHCGLCRTDRNGRKEFHLADYIRNAVEFSQQFVIPNLMAATSIPANRVAIAGHSVGGFVALQTLAAVPAFTRGVALAPVLLRFEAAPAGKGQRKFLMPASIWASSYLITGPVWLLPDPLKRAIAGSLGAEGLSKSDKQTMAAIMRPSFLWNSLTLARNGFDTITEPDTAMFSKIDDGRANFLFLEHDDWVPLPYVDELRAKCLPKTAAMNDRFRVVPKEKGLGHACCVSQPEAAAAEAVGFFDW